MTNDSKVSIREMEMAFAAYTGPFADGLKKVFQDWRAMHAALQELVDTDSDRAYGNCAAAVNQLKCQE